MDQGQERKGHQIQHEEDLQLHYDLCGGAGYKNPETNMDVTTPYVLKEYIYDNG